MTAGHAEAGQDMQKQRRASATGHEGMKKFRDGGFQQCTQTQSFLSYGMYQFVRFKISVSVRSF